MLELNNIKTSKHKKKQVSLENAIIYIKIEEKNIIRDAFDKVKEFYSNPNLIENTPQPNKKQNNLNNKHLNNSKRLIAKKKGHCFVCRKSRYYANQCKHKAMRNEDSKKPPKTNMIEGKGDDIIAAVVVSDVNMVNRRKDWVIVSGATRHIYNNKHSFFD